MPKRSSTRPRDPNQLAKLMVDIATGGGERQIIEETPNAKRARIAGSSGGTARARVLTPEQRSKIASIAAQARWKKG